MRDIKLPLHNAHGQEMSCDFGRMRRGFTYLMMSRHDPLQSHNVPPQPLTGIIVIHQITWAVKEF